MCKISHQYSSSGKYGNTYTINADIDNMPFKHNIADIIFSSLTLQWSLDLPDTIIKMKHHLKMDGILAISTIGKGTLTELQQSFAKKDSLQHINDNFISAAQLQLLLEQAGYKMINIYCQNITAEHKNLKDILYSIKKIGASYNARNNQYLGKNYFHDLEQIYQTNFGENNLLPASWNIIHAVAIK
jgi:malonyl-CoA O-methyltransferase